MRSFCIQQINSHCKPVAPHCLFVCMKLRGSRRVEMNELNMSKFDNISFQLFNYYLLSEININLQ